MLFVSRPVTEPTDIIPFPGKGEVHWRKGYSAYELAHSWANAGGIPDTMYAESSLTMDTEMPCPSRRRDGLNVHPRTKERRNPPHTIALGAPLWLWSRAFCTA